LLNIINEAHGICNVQFGLMCHDDKMLNEKCNSIY
jgi:hypothetical protein